MEMNLLTAMDADTLTQNREHGVFALSAQTGRHYDHEFYATAPKIEPKCKLLDTNPETHYQSAPDLPTFPLTFENDIHWKDGLNTWLAAWYHSVEEKNVSWKSLKKGRKRATC